jgi:hypothetical protein
MAKLHETVHYDPETGKFFWKIGGPKRRIGQRAGTINSQGYNEITIDRVRYRCARLAWYLSYDAWPNEIDHINQIRGDDRLSNLRDVDRSANIINGPARSPTGEKGISVNKTSWIARVQRNYRSIYIGSFATKEEAVAARNRYLESKR